VLRNVTLPGQRPNLWRPAASQLNPASFALKLNNPTSFVTTFVLLTLARALWENAERKRLNTAAHFLAPGTKLLPLVDLRTGIDIPGFPETFRSLLELDGITARRVLEALELPVIGADLTMLREKIRLATF